MVAGPRGCVLYGPRRLMPPNDWRRRLGMALDRVQQLAIGSLLVGGLVLGLKFIAYALTGSVALYSDALESIVNVATALAALLAVRLAAKPADENHPYGHHKAEYFAAALEGGLIVLAAVLIMIEAAHALRAPRDVVLTGGALTVSVGASVLNGIWCWMLIKEGRRHRSPALVADGKHLLSDVISSGGVVAGVVLAAVTGWSVLDPLLALAVAINIVFSGARVMMDSFSGLMDAAVPDATLRVIRRVIDGNLAGAIEAHGLRTRHAGRATFIDFHLVVPGDWTVRRSHDLCDVLETELEKAVDGACVTIHVEPEEKAEKAA